MDKTQLYDSIRKRKSRTGIITADRYFCDVEGCFEGGVCPIDTKGFSESEWRKNLELAEQKLTYTNPETEVLQKTITKESSGGIMVFDAIITTPFRDRDGDILETKGATFDAKMPLLWQHIPMNPIGSLVKMVKHTDSELRGRFVVADTALGSDSAKLIQVGALRISHGFEPLDYKLLEDEEGWRFKKFDIYETSVVSIPSNVEAAILEFASKDFDSELIRQWQKGLHANQDKTTVSVGDTEWKGGMCKRDNIQEVVVDPPATKEDTPCSCKKEKTEEVAEVDEPKSFDEEYEKTSDLAAKAFLLIPKAGSRLSNATKMELQEVMKDLAAIKGTEGLPRAVMALVSNAMDCVSGLLGDEEKSFEVTEREYFALLAGSSTEKLRSQCKRLNLMLSSLEEQQEAREWDEVLSDLT